MDIKSSTPRGEAEILCVEVAAVVGNIVAFFNLGRAFAKAECRARLVDGFRVDAKPCANLTEAAFNFGGDGSIGARTHIEQQVAVL
jgi:hypothetical protein